MQAGCLGLPIVANISGKALPPSALARLDLKAHRLDTLGSAPRHRPDDTVAGGLRWTHRDAPRPAPQRIPAAWILPRFYTLPLAAKWIRSVSQCTAGIRSSASGVRPVGLFSRWPRQSVPLALLALLARPSGLPDPVRSALTGRPDSVPWQAGQRDDGFRRWKRMPGMDASIGYRFGLDRAVRRRMLTIPFPSQAIRPATEAG